MTASINNLIHVWSVILEREKGRTREEKKKHREGRV